MLSHAGSYSKWNVHPLLLGTMIPQTVSFTISHWGTCGPSRQVGEIGSKEQVEIMMGGRERPVSDVQCPLHRASPTVRCGELGIEPQVAAALAGDIGEYRLKQRL